MHLAQKRKQQDKPLVRVAQEIALLQAVDGAKLLFLVDVDVEGPRPQRDAGEVLDLCRLRGGEEHGLAVVDGEDLDNLANLVLETDLEDAVGLVNDERLEVLEDKGRAEEVVQQAARRRDEQVDALGQLLDLGLAVGAAHDDAVRLRVVLHELARHAKDLQRQLARRRHDNDAGAVARLEAQRRENFDGGNQKRQRFT